MLSAAIPPIRSRWRILVISLYLGWLSTHTVVAQQSAFQWGFNDWTSTTLPQCQPLAIFVNEKLGTVKPAPPYYLAAYEVGGSSTIDLVGSKAGSLSWTVNHPAGSQLVLSMFDSNGNSGGILTSAYSIAGDKNGANASCIPTAQTSPITVTSNSTSKINTCDSVQLSISGGKAPYIVTIAETNAEAPFNVTMGPNDNTFTWVDNLTPGNSVIIVVSDGNGNYGQSTSLMALSGSTDTHCPFTSFSSSNTTNNSGQGNGKGNGGNNSNSTDSSNNNQTNQQGDKDNGDNKSSSKTGVIAGIVIAAFFSIFFGLLAWFLIRKRRKTGGGVRERKGWTIDRNDSIKNAGARARLPSNPSESDITPFTLPQSLQPTPIRNSHSYSDLQNAATPFMPELRRSNFPISDRSRGSFYRDQAESDVDEHDAYALDAFRTSGIGSSSGSRSNVLESQSSRSFRVINDEGDQYGARGDQSKTSLQNSFSQPQGQVFQHEDAGINALEEIPPAYPGPSNGYGGR